LRSRLQNLVWRDGTFILPHHFQASDRYFEDLLQFRFVASSYANWGFLELKVDVLGNSVMVRSARGLFPDGLPFDIRETGELNLTREIERGTIPEGQSVDVYLAIPRSQSENPNVFVPEGRTPSGQMRYLSQTVNVANENSESEALEDGDKQPVMFARPNLQLLVSTEPRQAYICLPLAKISITDRQLVKNSEFVPPSLTLGASAVLRDSLNNLKKELFLFRNSLSRDVYQRGPTPGGGLRHDLNRDLLLLQSVASCTAELSHLLGLEESLVTGDSAVGCHPVDAYRCLVRFAGSLQSFSPAFSDGEKAGSATQPPDPFALPRYAHDRPGPVFQSLIARINELLALARKRNWDCIVLRAEGEYYLSDLIPTQYLASGRFFLGIKGYWHTDLGETMLPVPELIRLGLKTKVGTAELGKEGEGPPRTSVFRLHASAIPGLVLEHDTNGPGVVGGRQDFQYFRLATIQEAAVWKDIQESRAIGIYLEPEILRPELELIVVLTS